MNSNWSMLARAVSITILLAMGACGGGSSSSGSGQSTPTASDSGAATNQPAGATPAAASQIVALDRSATVAGSVNRDTGIRVDIYQLVQRFGGNAEQQKALIQVAQSIQNTLINNGTSEAAIASADALDEALGCLASKTPDYYNQSQAIFAATVNTQERFIANLLFEKNIGIRIGEINPAVCKG